MSDQELKQSNLGHAPEIAATETQPAPAPWFTLGQVALGLALLLALGYYFWPMLTELVTEMANSENYSSGLLIPLVIGYIVYRKCPELRQPWRPSWWGCLSSARRFGQI